jgi:hypothetical protein
MAKIGGKEMSQGLVGRWGAVTARVNANTLFLQFLRILFFSIISNNRV